MLTLGRVFLRAELPEWGNCTAAGLKPFESTAFSTLNGLLRADLLVMLEVGSGHVLAACRVKEGYRDVQNIGILCDMLAAEQHGRLRTFLTANMARAGKEAFNFVVFDRVWDVRDLRLDADKLLEKGGFTNPLKVTAAGKRKPQNLGQGKVEATGGSYGALLNYRETHARERRCVLSEALQQLNEQTKAPFRVSNIEKHDNEAASTSADAANSSQFVNRRRACASLRSRPRER